MAPSSKHFPSLLIFFAILSSLQYSHARESYFFNKATTTNNKNAKETVEQAIPNKSNVQEKPEPNFIPDTQSGYGLYGQDSSRYPTTTANQPPEINSFQPYTTPTTNDKNNNYYKDEAYVSDPQGMMSDTRLMDKNNNNYYKDEAYVSDYQGVMSGTRFMDNNNNNNNNNYYKNTAYVRDPNEGMSQGTRNNYYNGGGRNYYNAEQQGMSDTRFLENGRYYYDINGEENYRNGPNGYQNFRRVNHNNRGYYGNYNGGSMEGYSQNGDDQFHESEAEYVP